jgi:hypothetical protein
VSELPYRLTSLKQINTVSTLSPLRIEFTAHARGVASTDDELMARKVLWAHKAGFDVLTTDVPASFAPFNAVIRISHLGTEDFNRDYLAVLLD